MSSVGSVTAWIDQLCAGNRDAAQHLWEGYYKRMVALARQKLGGAPRGMADEEDVALSAYHRFWRGAAQGRFRKAVDLVNHERREKRGGGNVRHEGSLAGDPSVAAAFDHIACPEPTPELAAQFADECRRLLEALEDGKLRAVALAKMEGCTTEEIAKRQRCSIPTVERKLARIRRIWGRETAR